MFHSVQNSPSFKVVLAENKQQELRCKVTISQQHWGAPGMHFGCQVSMLMTLVNLLPLPQCLVMIYSFYKQSWIIDRRNLDSTDPPRVLWLLVIIYSPHKQDWITDRKNLDSTESPKVLLLLVIIYCLHKKDWITDWRNLDSNDPLEALLLRGFIWVMTPVKPLLPFKEWLLIMILDCKIKSDEINSYHKVGGQ